MRRGFTLIEILTVVAIIAIMIATAMVGFGSGQGATRLKGATRDIYASIRQARSLALVTQQPAIITYGEKEVEGEISASITITAAKLISKGVTRAHTLYGDEVLIGDQPEGEVQSSSDGETSALANGGGETMEDVLFAPISEEVVKGIRIKVLVGEEKLDLFGHDEQKSKAKISVFSNVDYLLGRYNEKKSNETAAEETESDFISKDSSAGESASTHSEPPEPDKSVVWEVNGRCEPHKVWIYRDGQDPANGLCISVDRFGGAKVLSVEEAL